MDDPESMKQIAESTKPAAHFASMLWILSMGMWGGLVRFFQTRLSQDKIIELKKPRFWAHLCVELMTSAFVGVLAFQLCQYKGLDPQLTAVIVALAGHEGGRIMDLLIKVSVKRGFGA